MNRNTHRPRSITAALSHITTPLLWDRAVLSIVDLAARFGLPATEPSARHVIIVAQVGQQVVGLLVDAVSDILTVTGESIQPTPDVASDMARSFVRGVLAIDGRMISLITLDQVLPFSEREAA